VKSVREKIMTIARKPTSKTPSDADIQAIIEKGGSPAKASDAPAPTPSPKKETQNIIVQVPVPLLEEIDAFLNGQMVSPTRSQWIREAMIEKLKREKYREDI
jgi:hypothetical protein